MMDDMPVKAYAFPNGMLMVFDAHGQQVPRYQGRTEDYLPRLRADYPSCRIEGAMWDASRDDPIVRTGESLGVERTKKEDRDGS